MSVRFIYNPPMRAAFVPIVVVAMLRGGFVAASPPSESPGPGVSWALARERAERVSDLRYELFFDVPSAATEPVRGTVLLRFHLAGAAKPLSLDWRPAEAGLKRVLVNGRPAPFQVVDGHIVLPASILREGDNEFAAAFVPADAPLNRGADWLFTLLVPARASEIFPCFDQPDLKGRFSLRLRHPEAWLASSIGSEISRSTEAGRATSIFQDTPPLPPYLFAFVAGRFKLASARVGPRVIRVFHRETDEARWERNREAIFELHGRSLAWMESYTGIQYPWPKSDLVVIPAFQYNGMEHPGLIYYRASSILLDKTPTQEEELRRASVIAHETAHMWFGDLVTMRWFDDVWLKEVFANLMAAKMVEPSFPALDHRLRFLLEHHPGAYNVDRTSGTHPILQALDNIDGAGLLYGPIIYRKAPIVMRQLERRLGPAAFREGLAEYLRTYAMGNADWSDLLEILARHGGRDLAVWSRAWVEEGGRPSLAVETRRGPDGRPVSMSLRQTDPAGRGRVWPQDLEVLVGQPEGVRRLPARVASSTQPVLGASALEPPTFVLPDDSGLGYGRLDLDDASLRSLPRLLAGLKDPVERASGWLAMWEAVLEGRLGPERFLEAALVSVAKEPEELLVQRLLDYVNRVWWRFLGPGERKRLSPRLEAALWSRLSSPKGARSLRAALFKSFRGLAVSPAAMTRLESVWRREGRVPGVELGEDDETALALDLAVRELSASAEILAGQRARIQDPDRRDRFDFLLPAAGDAGERRRFFEGLRDPARRRKENWVAEALRLIHHPVRAAESEALVPAGLAMLEEVRATGDIFFPQDWAHGVLGGHRSPAAARAVRDYLAGPAARPGYPAGLRRIVLQAADELFRAERSSEAVDR